MIDKKRHAVRKRTIVMIMAVLVGALVITASSALLTYYGKVTTTANVSQSVLLDGGDYMNPITKEFDVIGGCCKWSCHELENTGCVNAPITFNTQYSPDGDGITTKYYTPTHYTFQDTAGTQPVIITVTDGECHITWTIDFPGEAPYDDPTTEGNGHWAVGLVIATDGDGNGPSFQIHNNDGTDATYPWGTWLYSPWGPTINDGWMGWHSSGPGRINIPLDELSCGWAEATGLKYNEVNPDGIFTITIAKCVLGEDFHWALNLAIGGGFWGDYMTYEQMSYPVGIPYFDWANPIVDMQIPNYEPATIMIDLSAGFTLGKYQSKEIIICHRFDIAMIPGTYIITSQIQPGP